MNKASPRAIAALKATLTFFTEHPEAKCNGELATTVEGYPTSPFEPNATCFCAIGRFAVEYGQLPEDRPTYDDDLRGYDPGWSEFFDAFGDDSDNAPVLVSAREVFGANDNTKRGDVSLLIPALTAILNRLNNPE
jgi:hypothetical protein